MKINLPTAWFGFSWVLMRTNHPDRFLICARAENGIIRPRSAEDTAESAVFSAVPRDLAPVLRHAVSYIFSNH